MITMIYAPPRTGKTALMTNFALSYMHGISARRDIKACQRVLEPLNNNGFQLALRPDAKHLVFADYTIGRDRKWQKTNWEIDGYYLGMPNAPKTDEKGTVIAKAHPVLFLPPCSRIFLDESQKYYDSRKSNYLSDFVSRFYELHGHYKMNIWLTVQRPGLIDLNIRELSQCVIEVDHMEHKYIHGLLRQTIWHCFEYDNVALAIRNIESGKRLDGGKKTRYIFDGNIFRHYDAENWFPAFLKGRENRKRFDMRPARRCAKTLQAITEFNELHDCDIPETYLKSRAGR